jgi:hypothetical protein
MGERIEMTNEQIQEFGKGCDRNYVATEMKRNEPCLYYRRSIGGDIWIFTSEPGISFIAVISCRGKTLLNQGPDDFLERLFCFRKHNFRTHLIKLGFHRLL